MECYYVALCNKKALCCHPQAVGGTGTYQTNTEWNDRWYQQPMENIQKWSTTASKVQKTSGYCIMLKFIIRYIQYISWFSSLPGDIYDIYYFAIKY